MYQNKSRHYFHRDLLHMSRIVQSLQCFPLLLPVVGLPNTDELFAPKAGAGDANPPPKAGVEAPNPGVAAAPNPGVAVAPNALVLGPPNAVVFAAKALVLPPKPVVFAPKPVEVPPKP